MDLSEWSPQGTAARIKPSEALDANALVAQLGGEVARTLSSALERVTTLATTGQGSSSHIAGNLPQKETGTRFQFNWLDAMGVSRA